MRTHKNNAFLFTTFSECGIFTEEAITRMDRLTTSSPGRSQNLIHIHIGFGAGYAGKMNGLMGPTDGKALAVGIGKNDYRLNP